jgi:DNA-binding transcriptional ArsR family regulator
LFDLDQTMTIQSPETAEVAAIPVLLQALSDPVRLEIVRQLDAAEGELTCGQLELPVGKSTCSHHLKALSSAGVIVEREEGVRKYLRLRSAELNDRYPGLLQSVLGGLA